MGGFPAIFNQGSTPFIQMGVPLLCEWEYPLVANVKRVFVSKPSDSMAACNESWQSGVIHLDEIQQLGNDTNDINNIEYRNTGDLVEDVKLIIDSAQRSAHQAVNVALVVRNWLLGRRIAEEELGDDTRQELYGRKVVAMLAEELTAIYGKGYTRTSLYQYVQFYRMFPEIVHSGSGQSLPRLSWTHYRELLRVQNPEARAWYEQEAVSQGWSVKQLSRNISSQYCERMLSNQVEPSHKDAVPPQRGGREGRTSGVHQEPHGHGLSRPARRSAHSRVGSGERHPG